MKVLLILISLFLTGCSSCELTIGQIVPQYIHPTSGCSAPLPDYKTRVTVTDNCGISSYVQTPAAGTIIQNTANVTLKVTDMSGNSRQTTFSVTVIDTVKPVFHFDPSLLAVNWDIVDDLYNKADKFLVDLLYLDTIINASTANIPDQIGTSYFTGINRIAYPVLNFQYGSGAWTSNYDGVAQIDSAVYNTKTLVITTPPGHAYNGIGKRMFNFE